MVQRGSGVSERQNTRLVKGLFILWDRRWAKIRAWTKAGENWADTAIRWVMLCVAAFILLRVVFLSWIIVILVILVVCVLALRAATKAAIAEKTKVRSPEQSSPETRTEDNFTTHVWTILGDAKAVHLATLARHLTETTGTAWTPDHVRAACKQHSIPVRDKVRDLGGDRVSSGVHRDDLQPLPQPLSEEAQEHVGDPYIAGQDGNAQPLHDPYATTPTPTTRVVGGVVVQSTPDPVNPVRTHVQVVDKRGRG